MDAELPYYQVRWARYEAYLKREKKIIRIFYIKYLDLNVYSTFGVHRLLALKNVVFCDAIYASRTS